MAASQDLWLLALLAACMILLNLPSKKRIKTDK
jgi:hypothetical protein